MVRRKERPKTGLAARAAANSELANETTQGSAPVETGLQTEPSPPMQSPVQSKAPSSANGGGETVVSFPTPSTAAAAHEARDELRPRRYSERTFRLKPEQVRGLKERREYLTEAIGYPKVTMDEIGRLCVQHFLNVPAEELLPIVQQLRGTSS